MRVQNLLFVLSCSLVGFVLNFAWEWVQCRPFFRHLESRPTVGSMLAATAGDVAQLMIVLILVSLITRRLNWFLGDLNLGVTAVIVSFSIILAILVEVLAIGSNRWTYTERNPVVPMLGVSTLPILQAIIINFVTLWISKHITFAFSKGETQSTEAL